MEDFERELHQALQRRPAPPSLKRRLMERRARQQAQRRQHFAYVCMRVAAVLVMVALLGGAAHWKWQNIEEHRKGEEARRQVLTALRITNHALNEVNTRLTARDRGTGDWPS